MSDRDWQKDWEMLQYPERYCANDILVDCEFMGALKYYLQRVRELERQVKLLTNALEEIVRYTPELIQIPEDLVHAVETCPDCQRAREAKWPPSGLCNKHYGEMSDRVWGPQEQVRKYQHLELRNIARKALEALDKEVK
jgi:hypothetical protein